MWKAWIVSEAVRCCGLSLTLGTLVGCAERDVEELWGLHEARIAHQPADTSRARVPSSAFDGAFSVSIPLGVSREDIALAATDSLIIGPGASVLNRKLPPRYAILTTLGDLVIEAGAEVGTVYDLGDTALELKPGAIVHGYIKTRSLEGADQARIESGFLVSEPTYTEEFRWPVAFRDPPERDATCAPDAAGLVDLDPGRYGSVTVHPRCVVRVRAGEYFIDDLRVSEWGTLEVDNTRGPVVLWVRRGLDLSGTMLEDAIRGDVMVGYAGDAELSIGRPLRATLIAPWSSVSLSGDGHVGALFARRIELRPNAQFTQRPFLRERRYPDPRDACARCYVEGIADSHDCVLDWQRAIAAFDATQQTCLSACLVTSDAQSSQCRLACRAEALHSRASSVGAREGCEQSIAAAYGRCELRNGFRVGTCARVGFVRRAPGDGLLEREPPTATPKRGGVAGK